MFVFYNTNGEITEVMEKLSIPLPIEPFVQSDLSLQALMNSYVADDVVYQKGAQPYYFSTFNYTTKQWEDPRTAATEWPLVRVQRDGLLQSCDWTQLPDVPLATKAAWAVYRQALRDVTEQTDPFNITWPVAP